MTQKKVPLKWRWLLKQWELCRAAVVLYVSLQAVTLQPGLSVLQSWQPVSHFDCCTSFAPWLLSVQVSWQLGFLWQTHCSAVSEALTWSSVSLLLFRLRWTQLAMVSEWLLSSVFSGSHCLKHRFEAQFLSFSSTMKPVGHVLCRFWQLFCSHYVQTCLHIYVRDTLCMYMWQWNAAKP